MSNQNFILTVYNFSSTSNNEYISEIDYQKHFQTKEDARNFVLSIYKFVDKTNIFRKNYVIAALKDSNDMHIEDYVGRGMSDSINKIQIWSRDLYNYMNNDFTWRIKDILIAA